MKMIFEWFQNLIDTIKFKLRMRELRKRDPYIYEE